MYLKILKNKINICNQEVDIKDNNKENKSRYIKNEIIYERK